jgi:hypothetical protein
MIRGWRKAKSFSPRRFATQQNSAAVLPTIHCNEHRAKSIEISIAFAIR